MGRWASARVGRSVGQGWVANGVGGCASKWVCGQAGVEGLVTGCTEQKNEGGSSGAYLDGKQA